MQEFQDFSSWQPEQERQFEVFERRTVDAGKKAWAMGIVAGIAVGIATIAVAVAFKPTVSRSEAAASENPDLATERVGGAATTPSATPAPAAAPASGTATDPAAAPAGAAPAEGTAPAGTAPAEGTAQAGTAPAEGTAPAGAAPAEGAGGASGAATPPAPAPGTTKVSPTDLVKGNQ
jgi:F0F1-type ATP synthase membrane subunit c/vacuolar-type H+-ATPase subunit K